MTGTEHELTELLLDTVDVGMAWGGPTLDIRPAAAAILARWVLVPVEDVCPNPGRWPVHAPMAIPRDCQACHDAYVAKRAGDTAP